MNLDLCETGLLPTSRLLLVVPIQPPDTPPQSFGSFAEIDSDVELPQRFFQTLRRAVVEIPEAAVDPSGNPAEISSGAAIPINSAEVVVVGDRSLNGKKWFLVANIAPLDLTVESWLETARLSTKIDFTRQIVHDCGVEPVAEDVRGLLLSFLALDGSPSSDNIREVALHFATRAPCRESLVRHEHAGETKLSDSWYQVVTRRACGFVLGNTDASSYFSTKLPAEMENQYLLAAVLAMWQLTELNQILDRAQDIWPSDPQQSADQAPLLTRGPSLRSQVEELLRLRAHHAHLTGTGSFGPVFDSGVSGGFWSQIQSALGVHRRYDEVSDALANLSNSTDTQASLSLERLLAFFTLVIGVPSLAFTVLGVNINRLTSETGMSGRWVVTVLIICLVAGSLAFLGANGLGLTFRHRDRRHRRMSLPPGAVTAHEEAAGQPRRVR